MIQRKSGTELPGIDELHKLLAAESPRLAVRQDFVSSHSQIYDSFRLLSGRAGSDVTWIDQYHSLSLEELMKQIDNSHLRIKEYIVHNSDENELYRAVYGSLVLPDDYSNSDAIFVFGGLTENRIAKAVELYQKGIASKLLLSGHRPFYRTGTTSEAHRMSEYALNKNIPTEDLILEEKAITLPDNVKRTLDLFEERDWCPESITYVVTDYVSARAFMEWYKFTPWNIKIRVVTAHAKSEYLSAEKWHLDGASVSLILNEYTKMIVESKIDQLRERGKFN